VSDSVDAPSVESEERLAAGGGWPLRRLLTEVVGSGPNTADDMTHTQAKEAAQRILDGRPAPETLGAFLLATRWKANPPTELAGFVDAMRERSVRTAVPETDPVDCGANYDGKADTALLGAAAGIVAAGAGTPVVVHSADRVPATRGVAYRHVLDELGVPTALAPRESARMVDATGFGFYDATAFNPRVAALLPSREQVGVRTVLNTVETLANPAGAAVHLGSFFHLSFAERIAGTVRESASLDVDRVLMVQGLEGYDDVRPGTARVAEWAADSGDVDSGEDAAEVETRELPTADHGVDCDIADLEVGDVAADSARIAEQVVAGERDDEFADAVALNAGLRVYARGDAEDVAAGVEMARDAVADGAAGDVLGRLRAFEWPSSRSG
jgi:anthranilate phosphoribosyltransferase